MKYFVILLIFFHSIIDSSWKINLVKNLSDLKIESAGYRRKNPKIIGNLTSRITASVGTGNIPFNYNVSDSSSGCSFLKLSDGYDVSFDGSSAHSILWDRKKGANCFYGYGKDICDFSKNRLCARLFLQKGDCFLSYDAVGFSDEPGLFDIVISGKRGSYFVSLNRVE